MIADTGFLIDLMRGDSGARERFAALLASGEPLQVAAVTIHELFYGVGLFVRPDEERARVRNVLSGLTTIPYEEATARRGGELEAQLRSSGQTLERADVMIAATANLAGEAVLTRDRRGFARVAGLAVETY